MKLVMVSKSKIFIILFTALVLCLTSETSFGNLIDYSSLDHKITVKSLRGGNHDESGLNKYYFVAKLVSLIHTEQELAQKIEKRKKKEVDLGAFGQVEVKPLDKWNSKNKTSGLTISGEQIRSLTSQTMKEFKVSENLITIMVQITLKEDNKKYFGLMGEDSILITEKYYPVPPAFFREADTKDKVVKMKDDLGTLIELDIKFTTNSKKKK